MLKLILGPDHKVNTKTLLDSLLQKTAQEIGNQYLIVPEQFSFEMERTLCRLGGDSISRYAEVLSLSRLADRVESVYGGVAVPWLDKGGRLLAAAQAVEQVRSRLKLFASVCQKPEFLETFLAAVDEFGGYGVTAELLTRAASGFSGQFSQKIEELTLLYESYFAVCAQAKDPVLRLQNLRTVLSEEDFAAHKEFYICLFSDFTTLEQEIIEELILKASSVTLSLPEESVCAAPVFPAAETLARSLKRFCKEKQIPIDVQRCSFDEAVSADVLHLQKNITKGENTPFIGDLENVSLCSFSSQEQELRHAAHRIARLVKDGARFRDIAVACSDFSLYGQPLSRVLDEAGIPHFSAGSDAAASLAGTQMVLSALRAVSFSLEQDTVLDWLKTGATSLTDDQCDRLENYAILWNISGSRFTKPFTWNPDGIGAEWTPQSEEALRELNAWREEALLPLLALRRGLHDAGNVRQMAYAVYCYMTAIALPQKMQDLSDSLYDSGEYRKAQLVSQIYDILVDALEQMALVMPDAVRTDEDFARLYEKLLSQYSVSAVPATVDEVMIGDIAAFRGKPVKHLLILGASEGSFPSCAPGSSIFTEDERRQLMNAGVPMAPPRADAVERELGSIYSTIRSAYGSVSISCTGDGAYLLLKAAAPFGGVTAGENEVVLNKNEYAAKLLRDGAAADTAETASIMDALRQRSTYTFGVLDPEQVAGLYGRDIRLSASKIDKFTACRFAYFMRYGLRAEERKAARFDASAFGTFVHAVLEETAKKVMELGGFREITDEQLQQIAAEVMEEYAKTVLTDLMEKDVRFRFLFERNSAEAMAVVRDMGNELRVSDFSPSAFELKFADDGQLPAIHVEGEKASCTVMGYVDRVDIYKRGDTSYVRVVDYKTGHKDFDYADIAIGEGMQMLIYLFALTQNGEKYFGERLQPAGVLYHMARQSVLSEPVRLAEEDALLKHEKGKVRKGLITDDDAVIHAMEHFEDTPKYLPISIIKDGMKGDLADHEQMERLRRHVFGTLAALADRIAGGDVNPDPVIRGPMNSACTYCEFSSVCQKDFAQHHERHMKKMSNSEFFAHLAWKEEQHGKA